MSYPGVAYSRVRPTQVWRTLEYSTTKKECTLRVQKLPRVCGGSYIYALSCRGQRQRVQSLDNNYIYSCQPDLQQVLIVIGNQLTFHQCADDEALTRFL